MQRSLRKLLKTYNLSPESRQKVIISVQRTTANCSGLHRLARKLECIQSAKDQRN